MFDLVMVTREDCFYKSGTWYGMSPLDFFAMD